MDMAVVEAEALKLSEEERALLVDHLQQSLSSSKITYLDEHLAESQSRFRAYRDGEIEALKGREFVNDLRDRLQK